MDKHDLTEAESKIDEAFLAKLDPKNQKKDDLPEQDSASDQEEEPQEVAQPEPQEGVMVEELAQTKLAPNPEDIKKKAKEIYKKSKKTSSQFVSRAKPRNKNIKDTDY